MSATVKLRAMNGYGLAGQVTCSECGVVASYLDVSSEEGLARSRRLVFKHELEHDGSRADVHPVAQHAIQEADRLGDRCAELEDLLAQVLESGWPLPQALRLSIASSLYGEED